MAKVTIEKSIDGLRESAFSVPAFVVSLAARLLPGSALRTLAGHGLDVRDILKANASGAPWSGTFDMREHGIRKQVSVSLDTPRARPGVVHEH